MPLNVFDRHAIQCGVIACARATGKLLFFRSVFLQGLLLLTPDKLPAHLAFGHALLTRWHRLCYDFGLTPMSAALAIAQNLASGFPLVIGAESSQQVTSNFHLLTKNLPAGADLLEASDLLAKDARPEFYNPSLWQK
jgi:hypothetical protein